MKQKMGLDVLGKKELKTAKGGVLTACLCGCLWDPDPTVKTDSVHNLNLPSGGN